MALLYDTGLFLYATAIRIAAPFKEKARLFIRGRRHLLKEIQVRLSEEKRTRVWIHCASLGEFEQGRPVIEAIRKMHPDLCIVLTFFSPSGYEVKKDYSGADYVFYLPLDTCRNAEKFISYIDPACALFVKYEFWYHYLATLHQKQIPAVLFSAIFQVRHPFFKWYGRLHRKMLGYYKHIFVQDDYSAELLKKININNVSVTGDTRFDRAVQVAATERQYPSIVQFKGDRKLLIAGSTWTDDELLLKQSMDEAPARYKLLVVPHETDESHIQQIKELFKDNRVCLWDDTPHALQQSEVCIVNTIGHLSFLYRYADAVWIGGGFTKTGIHNIIEPAVYGAPVCFGPNYKRYREAIEMLSAGGAHTVSDSRQFIDWLNNEKALLRSGSNAKQYVLAQLGATKSITDYLEAEKCFFSTEKKL